MTNTSPNQWMACLNSTAKIIGRAKDAEIRIPASHQTVSRKHAAVWQQTQSAWICDLASTHGTYVNGVQLSPHHDTRIDHGDRILIGTLELNLIDEEHVKKHVLLDDQENDSAGGDTFKTANKQTDIPAHRIRSLPELSHAEREVVLWVSRGLTRPEEIGAKLHRSPHTVRTQLNSIFQKLGVHSRDELLGFLLKHQDPRNSETI